MNLKLFSDALVEVFQEVGVSPVSVSPLEKAANRYELVSSLGITGDMHGYLVLKSSLSSAKEFVGIMAAHMGMDVEENDFGQFHKAAIGEITNQISGRATMLLAENGYDCLITPPTIVTGSNVYMEIPHLEFAKSEKIEGNFGSFGLFVGIKNVKKLDKNG